MRQSTALSRSNALGLLAYVNQAELSLDRTPPDNYADLVLYYSLNIRPQVSDVVERLHQLVLTNPCSIASSTDWHLWEKRLASIPYRLACYVNALPNWYLRGTICLEHDQMKAVSDALLAFSGIVCGSFTPSQDERIDVRLKLAYSALIIGVHVPNKRLVFDARNVEHLNQSEHLKLRSVNEIAGSDWMF
jgi:hypothetical protein